MKTTCLLLLVSLLILTGCSRRYVVTLTSGNQITAFGKPKLKDGAYYFKNAKGEEGYVPALRVREIQPESMADDKSDFKAPSKK